MDYDDVDDEIRTDMEGLDHEELRRAVDAQFDMIRRRIQELQALAFEYRFYEIRRTRQRMAVLMECVVCQRYAGSNSVCNDCFRLKSTHSPPVWKAWMAREQADYQRHFGCSQWNLRYRSGVHLQRNIVTPELLPLKRVKVCIGWEIAIYGLIFEFLDGTRAGYVFGVRSIHDDAAIARRRCTEWVNIERGDFVRSVKGHHCSRGSFLCHTLELTLASGRTLRFASDHNPWKGEAFAFDLPEFALLHHVSFRDGKCIGVTAAETFMHLPCGSPKRVSALPRVHQQTFHLLQLVARRFDTNRQDQGDKPLGKDLWNIILTEYLACHDLQPYDQSPIGKLEQQQQQQPSPIGQLKGFFWRIIGMMVGFHRRQRQRQRRHHHVQS